MPSRAVPKITKRDAPDYVQLALQLREGKHLKTLWTEYCRTVARPYSFGAFANNVYAHLREDRSSGEPLTSKTPHAEYAEAYNYSLSYWSGLVSPVRPVVALGPHASIRMRLSRLQVYDHVQGERYYETGGILPRAIVFRYYAGQLTVPALKFCRDHGIAVSIIDEFGELLSIIEPPGKISAALIRAQCAANPIVIAREILIAKLNHSNAAKCLTDQETKAFITKLKQCRTVTEFLRIEASAAKIYWSNRACELRVRKHRSLPSAWQHFKSRVSSIGSHGARHADHPMNSMLNLAYHATAGRLGAALASYGACLAIGFLHGDRQGRYSLSMTVSSPCAR